MNMKMIKFCLKKNFWKKVLSYLTIISLFANSILPYGLVAAAYAQESTPTEIPTSVPTIIPDLTPTIDLIPTITVLPTIEPTPEATPTAIEPAATPELTPTITVEPSVTPTLEASPTAVIEVTTPTITPNISTEPTNITSLDKVPFLKAEDLQKYSKKQVNKDYIEGEVIVKFKQNKINVKNLLGKAQAFVFEKKFALVKTDEIKNINVQVFKSEKSTLDLVKELKADSSVEYAEPNYIRPWSSTTTPNDTDFSLQWALNNTTTPTADVSAPEAWNFSQGNNSVIVGILDSGIAYNHPDLVNNMWDGSSCKDENNLDASCPNHGWDFVNLDNDPVDDNGHGTHVAGIIGAKGNNSKGIAGINWNVKLMALKVGDYSGAIVGDVVKAIDFAINNNVKVLNASWGGVGIDSQAEYDAINKFRDAGGIFVTAAGNGGNDGISDNNENAHYYPCDYDSTNIICVAATDQNDALGSFSNYGATSVDVGAPGVNIYSTEPFRFFDENFENVSFPSIGNKFIQSGGNTWGTKSNVSNTNKAIFSDYANWGQYQNNKNSILESQTIDLSGKLNSYLGFEIYCDTEPDYDGVILSFFNGSVWTNIDGYTGNIYDEFAYSLQSFVSSNFKIRYEWIADDSINNYDGCWIDNIKINDGSSSNEQYQYMQGTSMAAPHVTGLVALMWGAKPDLTVSQIKTTILDTGDIISSLSGKTVSEKRINAYNAMDRIINSDNSVFRFWNKIDGRHFFTMSEVEKNQIIDTLSDTWTYEGIAYDSLEYELFDSVPLFRFWNKIYGNHFYTTSVFEKDGLIANNFDTWNYEGIAYYVYPLGSTTGTTEVFRFWNKINGRHFYTTSVIEKDGLIANNSDVWNYEGLAWQVSDD